MLEAGDRDGGIRELENAMSGAEHAGDLDLASSLAEEIARLEPELGEASPEARRVRVSHERPAAADRGVSRRSATRSCASDQADKARSIYQRVIDLAPDEVRARAALDTIVVPEPEPPPPPMRNVELGRRPTGSTRVANEPEQQSRPSGG